MDEDKTPKNEIRQVTAAQRRVVGVLMEKAFTTPEQYPLTLKALTSGCNQKSNRFPMTRYSESDTEETIDELRELQLVAEVFIDGGRAARYRHYMRYRYDFSESQFAVIAELLLRGGQHPGELRTRASRMVRVESQQQLKDDLTELQLKGFIRSSGPLERRGVIVDHTFYLPEEAPSLEASGMSVASDTGASSRESRTPAQVGELEHLREAVAGLQREVGELRVAVARLENG